jgi:putative hemolysin
MTVAVLIVVVLILLNALYVAAEFAVLGARVSRVQRYSVQGSALASALLPIVTSTARLDNYIAACQIGITASSLVLGAYGQAAFGLALAEFLIAHTDMTRVSAYALAAIAVLVVLTSIQVIFGELVPKTIALQYPVRTAMYTYLPMRWSLVVFSPLITLLNGSGAMVLRAFGVSGDRSHRHIHSPDEIELLVRESRAGGLLDERQRVRLQRALRLSRHPVRQIMTPRRHIVGIDLSDPVEQTLATLSSSPYSRLVVHRGGLDQVVGIVHVRDVAALLARGQKLDDLTPLVQPVMLLSWRLTLDLVLGEMRRNRARLALVVDDSDEVEGLVSLEDILRELVGTVADEFKVGVGREEPIYLSPGRWRLPGSLPLDELSEWALALGIEPAWSTAATGTLAGWLIGRAGRLPQEGQQIKTGPLQFTVEKLSGVAIVAVDVEYRPNLPKPDHA